MLYLMICSDRRVFDVIQPLAYWQKYYYGSRATIVKAIANSMIMTVDLVLSILMTQLSSSFSS